MGLSSTTNRVSFTGDGSSTVFSFPYYFFSVNDLSVYLYDTNSSLVTAQAINTNYTISGNVNSQGVYPSGGNVVMNSAFPGSYQLIITRNPSPIQNFQLTQNGPISSLALTQQLDYLTTLVQRLQDEVSRAVQLPDGLGASANGSFNQTLLSSIMLNSTAYAPLCVNSGANGWQFGVVATGASGAIGYAGLLPVTNGGTGQGGGLTPNAVWYSVTGSTMAQTNVGNPGQVLMAGGSSVPKFTQIDISNSSMVTGALSATAGGTGLSTFVPQYGVMYASSNTQMSIVPPGNIGMSLLAKGSSTPVFEQMNLASSAQFTGILPVANGGTNASSAPQALINLWPTPLTRGDLLLVNSGAVVSRLAVGTDNFVLTANSSSVNPTGVLWQNPSSTSQALSSRTSNYQMTANDDFILVSSSAFTVILPDATTATKKLYKVIKTDNTLLFATNQIILSGSGAQTIGTFGNTVNLLTVGEAWEVFPDGANWQIISHQAQTDWSAVQSSVLTAGGSGTYTKGTVTTDHVQWRRDGRNSEFRFRFTQTVAGTNGVGNVNVNLPGGLLVDTSDCGASSSVVFATVINLLMDGSGYANFGGSANWITGPISYMANSSQFCLAGAYQGINSMTWGSVVGGLNNTININLFFRARINNWSP